MANSTKGRSRAAHAPILFFSTTYILPFGLLVSTCIICMYFMKCSSSRPSLTSILWSMDFPYSRLPAVAFMGKPDHCSKRYWPAVIMVCSTGVRCDEISLSYSSALIHNVCFDLDDCLSLSQIENNQIRTPWCSILRNPLLLLIQFVCWNKYLFNWSLIWEIGVIWVGAFFFGKRLRFQWFLFLFFCFFYGMFCEFDFKGFLSVGKHTAGNKQIRRIIATSPASTAVVGF